MSIFYSATFVGLHPERFPYHVVSTANHLRANGQGDYRLIRDLDKHTTWQAPDGHKTEYVGSKCIPTYDVVRNPLYENIRQTFDSIVSAHNYVNTRTPGGTYYIQHTNGTYVLVRDDT